MLNSGGVGVYVKYSIVYSIRHNLHFANVSYKSIWLEISVENNSKELKFLMGLIYRHLETEIPKFREKFWDFLLENIYNYNDIVYF